MKKKQASICRARRPNPPTIFLHLPLLAKLNRSATKEKCSIMAEKVMKGECVRNNMLIISIMSRKDHKTQLNVPVNDNTNTGYVVLK